MATVPAPKRGEIWLVNFDPAVGGEIRKLRPAVVISLDTIGQRTGQTFRRGRVSDQIDFVDAIYSSTRGSDGRSNRCCG